MDVALHKAGVTLVLDRSGITGPDGASHHGMWDLSLLQFIPGLNLAAPRDAATLREAVAIDDAADRLSGTQRDRWVRISLLVERRSDGVDVLTRTGRPHPETGQRDVLFVAVGAMARGSARSV